MYEKEVFFSSVQSPLRSDYTGFESYNGSINTICPSASRYAARRMG